MYKNRQVTFLTGSGNSQLIDTAIHCVENDIDPIQFIRTMVLTRHLRPTYPRTHVLIGVVDGLFLLDIGLVQMKEEELDYNGLYVLGSGTPHVTKYLKENKTEDLHILFQQALNDCSTSPEADVYDVVRDQWTRLHFKGERKWTVKV